MLGPRLTAMRRRAMARSLGAAVGASRSKVTSCERPYSVEPVVGSMTLLRATALAGGRTEFTAKRHVVVFRVVEGQRLAALYDLKSIEQGAHPDPQIYPNDIIVYGESSARRLFKDLINFSPLLTTPLLIVNTIKP